MSPLQCPQIGLLSPHPQRLLLSRSPMTSMLLTPEATSLFSPSLTFQQKLTISSFLKCFLSWLCGPLLSSFPSVSFSFCLLYWLLLLSSPLLLPLVTPSNPMALETIYVLTIPKSVTFSQSLTWISNCLLNISTQMSNMQLRHNLSMKNSSFLPDLLLPQSSCF